MRRLTIDHTTVYRYQRPVSFGEHRMMFRPRDSHDIHLVDSQLEIAPAAEVQWLHDVFGNSITVARFEGRQDDRLSLRSVITIDHYGGDGPDFAILPHARRLPFAYDAGELSDLGRTNERHFADPEHRVNDWARRFIENGSDGDTRAVLLAMTMAIRQEFEYRERYEQGVQNPIETLAGGGGSCRDLAVLMMEAVRSLGLAARFVTGYLFGGNGGGGSDRSGVAQLGGGATHAWLQIYLPGAGWLEYDPTNGSAGGANLIRVAVAREPSQAVPVQGSYIGAPEDFIEMQVTVEVQETGAV
jgi:transglutaminase-like putative cysteine protease